MTPVSAETDLMTDDGATRSVRRLPRLGVLLAGALALSACGGSSEGGAQASSGGPTEGSSASASTAEADEISESDDGGTGEESPSADGSSEDSGNGDSGGDGSGEPVPASSEGPAQNMPVPEAPARVTENSQEGAEAALEYWWELDAYARNTGDVEPLKEFSAGDCTFCVNRVNHVIKTYDEGGWWKQEPHGIGQNGLTNQGDDTFKGPFEINEGSFTTFDGDSAPEVKDGAQDQVWGALLTHEGEHWVVRDLSSSPEGFETEGDT